MHTIFTAWQLRHFLNLFSCGSIWPAKKTRKKNFGQGVLARVNPTCYHSELLNFLVRNFTH